LIDPAAGYFAFYIKLTASQVLGPNMNVTAGEILADGYLGAKTCAPKPGSKMADCVPDRKTFREYMASQITNMPLRFFDLKTPELRKKIFDTCTNIRIKATESLGLSTIDALLVRWAAVKKSGLLDVLLAAKSTDPQKKKVR
jgi:hypothetical protein